MGRWAIEGKCMDKVYGTGQCGKGMDNVYGTGGKGDGRRNDGARVPVGGWDFIFAI